MVTAVYRIYQQFLSCESWLLVPSDAVMCRDTAEIRINDQWRLCFEWPKGTLGPTNVEIVDYH